MSVIRLFRVAQETENGDILLRSIILFIAVLVVTVKQTVMGGKVHATLIATPIPLMPELG